MTPAMIDSALYNAFGQRLVSTIFTQTNQYRVVLEVGPEFRNGPAALDSIYVNAPNSPRQRPRRGRREAAAPASARFDAAGTACRRSRRVIERPAPLVVSRIGQFPAATISFNLARGASLGDAVKAIEAAQRDIGMPVSAQVKLQGAALAFRASLANQLWLILAAIVTVYIVLGVLYESYIHPITILSTLPSAGVGALLALLLTGNELGVIAIIGIILLIGIVKKNAIMMIDFAIDAERDRKLAPRDAIFEACLLALPADHDDHDGGAAGRAAADDRLGRGFGAAPSARHHDGRRPDPEPGADAVHDAGHLSRVRPAGARLEARRERLPRGAGRGARRSGADGATSMNISSPFIDRPVATTLLTIGAVLAGAVAFRLLPVSPLPRVDLPTISVSAHRCRGRVPRRWRRRSRCRSSARWASSPASRK